MRKTSTTPTTHTSPLHGWRSVTDVAQHLHLCRGTVYAALLRAIEQKQDWVKREEHPTGGTRRKWLMNTDSPLFQFHEQRWQRLHQKHQPPLETPTAVPPATSATWGEDWSDHPWEHEPEQQYEADEIHLWSTPPPLSPPPLSFALGQIPPPSRRRWWRTGLVPILTLQIITIACILITRQPRRTRYA